MIRKFSKWFTHLSKMGKIGIVMAAVAAAGVAAAPGTPPQKAPEPASQPAKTESKSDVIETKIITETEPIPFKALTRNDTSLNKGQTKVAAIGSDGEKAFTYEVTLKNGVETSKKLLKEEVTAKPVDQVTLLGTYVAKPKPKPQPNCDPNYRPCVPNVSYDLDCPDIGISVTVVGYDKHGFDGNDNDGYGCESY